LKSYDGIKFGDDVVAGLIVTIMLVPQSLAYALIAGLPPQMGLYASIAPLAVYAIFGTSRTLSVGPVAVVSLMTATALSKVAMADSGEYIAAAVVLALMVGVLLLGFGLLRAGFLANLLSHPVVAGFISASAVIIALGQLPNLLGISASGHNVLELAATFFESISETPEALGLITPVVGICTIAYLLWARSALGNLLVKAGINSRLALILSRSSPVVAVVITGALAFSLDLETQGLALVGSVPAGLPSLELPTFSVELWRSLVASAALIAMLAFVESVSVAQGLAARKRERVDPDQELIGLGAANISSAFFGGFPVAGGFARSVVNYDAGAATPAAGLLASGLIAACTFLFMPALAYLPKATLAATIIVAVWSLVDFRILVRSWHYSKADFIAVSLTILVTLFGSVEAGVGSGILVSVLGFLYNTAKPHAAIVGLVPGTEHFRNVKRHKVETHSRILSLRVDESLYFANSRYLEDLIYKLVAEKSELKHIVLMCNAINNIDLSALESLLEINAHLEEAGIEFHLSEIKGPVMDKLEKTSLLSNLSGNIYLTQYQAIQDLK